VDSTQSICVKVHVWHRCTVYDETISHKGQCPHQCFGPSCPLPRHLFTQYCMLLPGHSIPLTRTGQQAFQG